MVEPLVFVFAPDDKISTIYAIIQNQCLEDLFTIHLQAPASIFYVTANKENSVGL